MKTQTLATDMEFGGVQNRVRSLQNRFDYWFARRQGNPVMAQSTEQMIAEHECLKLGPQLFEAKQKLQQIKDRYQ